MTTTEVKGDAPAFGHAMAAMSVHRAKDGSFDHYYSLDYIPWWKLKLRRRYQKNFLDHVAQQPKGRIWVEVPNHPRQSRRPRRRYA